ncbi:MAG: macro domain-containing protein [Planctomycetota bacterium]|nr:macro domain-containing protein [Planctomycetota bacterium]
MKVIQGDLIELVLDGQFDVIIHGCNCQCAMGAGIAKTIKERLPEAYQADRQTTKADKEKMGSYSKAFIVRDAVQFTVVNAYTQFHWRGKGVLVDYDALRAVMRAIRAEFTSLRIGYPKIGAGFAKGDWDIIAQIIDEELTGEDHTLVEFQEPLQRS